MIFRGESRDLTPSNTLEYRAGRPEHWTDEALCAQTDPETFFPTKGGSTTAAKRVCAACPAHVRAACLEDALAGPEIEDYGIRGGLSRNERKAIRRARAAARRAA